MKRVKRLTIRAFQPHRYTYDNVIYLCVRVWVCGYIQRRRSFLRVYNTIICIVKIIISKSFFFLLNCFIYVENCVRNTSVVSTSQSNIHTINLKKCHTCGMYCFHLIQKYNQMCV